ncbi:MAG: hypothetical protein QOI19_288, partial [Thermoleophilaceae bacterium]|nr:hypothetical protein [Thermoleophilaceae bacterium]
MAGEALPAAFELYHEGGRRFGVSGFAPMGSTDVVDTPEDAREQELEPLIVREPLERF